MAGQHLPMGPVPVSRPKQGKYHELEDLDKYSSAIFSDSRDPDKWNKHSIREAQHLVASLGKALPKQFQTVTDAEGVHTLNGRLLTYSHTWRGWPPLDMALTGLYLNRGLVTCAVCGVTFRKLQTRDICHLYRHKQLAPHCVQLLRYQCAGPNTTPVGKRIRRNSASAAADFMVSEQ